MLCILPASSVLLAQVSRRKRWTGNTTLGKHTLTCQLKKREMQLTDATLLTVTILATAPLTRRKSWAPMSWTMWNQSTYPNSSHPTNTSHSTLTCNNFAQILRISREDRLKLHQRSSLYSRSS